MASQFDTYDNLGDRRELVILFHRLGEGLPDYEAKRVRADFLQGLIVRSLGRLAANELIVNPDQCGPTGAYRLFCHITGVLEVPIGVAAKLLDETVKRREWMSERNRKRLFNTQESPLLREMRTIIHCTE